ncbi:alpha-amylase family glycosyl hydrolase [Bacteroidota bacterium]
MKTIHSIFLSILYTLYSGNIVGQEDFMVNLKKGESLGVMDYPAPEWLRDAVIVELPVRGFNCSDNKDPSKWKYRDGDGTFNSLIEKLDFLKGMGINVLCLYSVYDCDGTNLFALHYDDVSPDMGTMDDLKNLIKESHKRDMYVISNTNHYGVSRRAPMLKEHPGWFLPEDQQRYNQRVFDLGNPEARQYIIDVHAWWCTDIGLDGWRIDCASEFSFKRDVWNDILKKCNDKGKKILIAPEGAHLYGYIEGGGRWGFPEILDMQYNCPRSGATQNDPYRAKEISGHNVGQPNDKSKTNTFNNSSNPGPREGNYRIKGSRFLYGHNSMFAPMVPIMMTGEAINATQLGIGGNSKMLHSWIDWTDTITNKDVVDDFHTINQIRLANKDIFHFNMYETNLINVPYESMPASPVNPYVRFITEEKAGIVIGNNSTTQDVTFKLHLPLAEMGMNYIEDFYVTDCWTSKTGKIKRSALDNYTIVVPKDKSKGGGVRIIIISKEPPDK